MGIFKIKSILILSICLLLCGCSASYEIEIANNAIVENASLIEKKEDISETSTINNEFDLVYNNIHDKENGQEETKTKSFIIEKINDNMNLGLKYKNKFTFEDYDNSPVINQCYENVNIYNDDNFLSINTSSYFKCFDYYKYLNEVTIKLKTDYKIDSSNSDEVKDNILYWYITEDNYLNKSIKVKILKNNENLSLIENIQSKKNNKKYVYIILGVIGIGILISVVVIYEKVKNSNK